jgi:NADPH2:quinone reductase
MESMKAVRFATYGGPDVLEYCDVERPRPRPGEILVSVIAAGVNPADHKFRSGGLAAHRPKVLPLVPGMDIAGRVTDVGAGASDMDVGDIVFGMLPPARLGGYAEFVAASAGFFAKVPPALQPEAAAALPTAGLTGMEIVEDDLSVQAGQRLLVIGALGAVGRAAVFAARRIGCHITCAVRRERIEEATFADAAVDAGSTSEERFDAIVDTVGGETAGRFVGNLMSGGVMSSVSTVRIPPSRREDVIVRNFVCYPDRQRLADLATAVLDGFPLLQTIETGRFSEVAAIHGRLEAGASVKFVLIP